MKKCYCYCAGPVYYRMLNRRLLFKANSAAVAPKETITHHFFVSELGRRNWLMQLKFVAAQKMLLKQKPSNTKWIARFAI